MNSRYKFTNLGNTVSLAPPPGAIVVEDLPSLPTYQSLVQADLLKDYPEAADNQTPGSWVIALDGQVIDDQSNGLTYAPIVCQVIMGAGGSTHVVEVDPWQAIVPVPAGYVDVRVAWDPDQIVRQSVSPLPLLLPRRVDITATIQRSFAAGFATKTKCFEFDSGNQTQIQIPLPNFAESFSVHGAATTGFSNYQKFLDGAGEVAITSDLPSPPGPNGFTLERITDADLWATLVANACTRPLPPANGGMVITPGLNSLREGRIPYTFRFNLALR
jgi:hypothetical protein